MRKQIIIGNWKMNKDLNETKNFFKSLNEKEFAAKTNLIYGIALPTINIPIARSLCKQNLVIASQDVSCHDKGAYTGEISAAMLKSHDVSYVLVGHSERRQYHAETSDIVNKKAKKALEHGITPIVCVGETLTEYEDKQSKNVIKSQIEVSLKDLDYTKIVIAYEPVWAIGTGKTASFEYAQEMCHYIRTITSNEVLIQYGGSVNDKNVNELLLQPDIDGALVGGASLEVDTFVNLIKA